MDCDIAGINKNVTLAHVKQHLKIISGIIKSRSTTSNIKIRRNCKNAKGTHGKITWKVIRICSSYNENSKRCLLCLNEDTKLEHTKDTTF